MITAILFGATALADDFPPVSTIYILNWAICANGQDNPCKKTKECACQTVPSGAPLQIQLPGTPSKWKIASSSNIEFLDQQIIPDQLRIEGSDDLYLFNFKVGDPGKDALITFKEAPPFLTKPNGVFIYRIKSSPIKGMRCRNRKP